MAGSVEATDPRQFEFLDHAKVVTCYSHGMWNGTGDIVGPVAVSTSLSARVMVVARNAVTKLAYRAFKGFIPHVNAVRLTIEGAKVVSNLKCLPRYLSAAEPMSLSRSGLGINYE
ncbi:hypothetical protein GCM10007907_37520 [Chitinimonas prasina]|uniref:Uncharacterized protein n=1 Tax=Chitinimonas prasina TaxID=1434937 RepID=A0ABQ5YKA3_9NEIS|nr:hypothetical protein [Chitinimonas prasina]GLR14962.1 hypothetical protein GCM10007907_37520 [Chitinimonas prasina]